MEQYPVGVHIDSILIDTCHELFFGGKDWVWMTAH